MSKIDFRGQSFKTSNTLGWCKIKYINCGFCYTALCSMNCFKLIFPSLGLELPFEPCLPFSLALYCKASLKICPAVYKSLYDWLHGVFSSTNVQTYFVKWLCVCERERERESERERTRKGVNSEGVNLSIKYLKIDPKTTWNVCATIADRERGARLNLSQLSFGVFH